MKNTSFIEIDSKAIANNIRFIKKLIGPNTEISSVIKGNAYGHGIEPMANILTKCGIKNFSVFSFSEAFIAKQFIPKNSRLIIMGMIDQDEIEWAIKNNVELFVFDFNRLDVIIKTAKKLNKKALIHIEVETGMNRTGFVNKHIERVIKKVNKFSELLTIKGICTHLAGAESITNYYRIQKQFNCFNSICKSFLDNEIKPESFHTACSAAAISYPESRMDMIRLGILQYGFWPSIETYIGYLKDKKTKKDPLKQAISWKTKIMSIKNVKKGEFIGYGSTYLARKNLKTAIIPVGYSNGFSRSLSNQGRVLVNGHRVGVIGLVNMNLMIIDITNISNIKKGDEVVLIGKNGDLKITISSFSELSDQLNYELLVRLPENIPRIVR